MNLPKPYLSYSAWSLWKKDKASFRRRYYEGEKGFETKETIFGKEIAKLLESDDVKHHPVLSKVPRYAISEYEIKTEYKGIKILGYIDSFDPVEFAFLEYKSGHASKDGKPPWDVVKVQRHEQLVFYNAFIRLMHGKAKRKCKLVWIETELANKTSMFKGIKLTSSRKEVRLTGRVEIFERTIFKYETDRLLKDIVKVAKEISDDYTEYQNQKRASQIHAADRAGSRA